MRMFEWMMETTAAARDARMQMLPLAPAPACARQWEGHLRVDGSDESDDHCDGDDGHRAVA